MINYKGKYFVFNSKVSILNSVIFKVTRQGKKNVVLEPVKNIKHLVGLPTLREPFSVKYNDFVEAVNEKIYVETTI